MSTSESLSNKAGNATDGVVGEETLLHQAQSLAAHGLDFAKVKTGMAAPSTGAEVSPPTLGSLIGETKNLVGAALHSAQEIVAGDASAPKEGYVAKARDLAAQGLGTAHSYVAAGAQKVNETAATTTEGDIKAEAEKKKQQALDALGEAKGGAGDAINRGTESGINAAENMKAQTQDVTKH